MTHPHELRRKLRHLDPERRAALLRNLDDDARNWINGDFGWRSHQGQLAPSGDWRTWILMAGRGFGKTRAGAEWVLAAARGRDAAQIDRGQKTARANPIRIGLVAASIDEARAIMVEGPSGLRACAVDDEIALWSPSLKLLRFANGAEARLYSGAHAEGLRGADLDLAWCDELAKWPQGDRAWANLQLALRRGARPRCLITTTPRSGPLLDHILALPDTVETGGATRDNPFNAPGFAAALEAEHAGTRWAAQELEGKLLRDVEGSLWKAELVERCRVAPLPSAASRLTPSPAREEGETPSPLAGEGRLAAGERGEGMMRIVIGVDPPATVNGTCGIVVCGLDAAGLAYVLADESISGASPEQWARAVAAAFDRWQADRVIAEINMGGDMVESILRSASLALPVRQVRATRGKVKRAEPVAALFENGRAFFAGMFPELEAELAGFTNGGGY